MWTDEWASLATTRHSPNQTMLWDEVVDAICSGLALSPNKRTKVRIAYGVEISR